MLNIGIKFFILVMWKISVRCGESADDLWISFQNGVKNFVNNHGGNSQLQSPVIERPNWQKIKDVIDGKLPLSTLSSDCDD